MLMDLSKYDKYFKDGEDGKIVVKKETPEEIKSKLKKINKENMKLYNESIFEFEG